MASSGVGQFSINVKSNLRDFYGDLTKAKRTMKELTDRKNQLQIDSSQLDKLRDKSQRIAAEMRELRQQKTEIKLGMKNVENADEELKKIDQRIASLNRQKLEVEADIQPIRTANVELHKTEQEIDRLKGKKVEIDFGNISSGIDGLSDKISSLIKTISTISFAGLTGAVGVLKEAVNAASDLEQNTGGVNKLFGEEASKDVMKKADNAYKTAGMSKNNYLEQATKYSASLITSLQEGQTVTIDSSDQKEALKKRKNEIEKALKENNYNSTEVSLSAEPQYEYITEKNGKIKKKKIENTETKKQLKDYKRNKLELQKEKDKIDEQIANLPDKTTKKVGGMDKKVAQKKAAEYVDKALVDMSDNVNTFGGDAGLVQNTYGGIAKGNYAMLDNLNLGFKATQEGAIDVVNTYGKLDHKVTDISEVTFPMMIDAIHNAQEAMNISGTTAKEAATTYEGSFKMMKGAWNDFLATGDPSHLADAVPIYLDNLDKKLKDLTPKIIDGVKQLVKELPPKLAPVIEDIKKIVTESLDSIFGKGTVDNFVKGMNPFIDIIKKVFEMLSKSSKGDKPDFSWVGSVIPDLLKLAFGLKAASAIFKGVSFAQKIGLKFPSFKGLGSFSKSTKEFKAIGIEDLKSLGMKMLTVAGLSANIYLAAKALQQVQKIGDLGDLQPKMLALAEAVAGMGVIAMAVGKLDQLTGGSLKKGLFYVAGVSADIYFVAKALQEVGEIDSDFGSIQSKIGQIALAITEIGALALTVGAIMSTGVGTALLTTGLLSILGIAGTLFLAGKSVASISNLELDSEKIETNIGIIKNTIDQMKGISGDDKLLENIKKFVNSLLDSGITTNIVSIGNKLIDIQELKFDGEKLQGNIQVIKGFIDKLDDFNFDANPFPALGKWFTSMFDNGIFGSIIKIGNKMMEMQKLTINTDAVTTNIKAIQTAMNSIRDLYTGFDPDETEKKGSKKGGKNWLEQAGEWAGSIFKSTPVGKVAGFVGDAAEVGSGGMKVAKTWTESSAIGNIVSVGKSIKKIQNLGLNEKQATTQIGIIKTMLSKLFDVATEENVKNLNGLSDALNKIVENLIEKFPPEFNDFGQLLAEKLNDGFKNKLNLQKVLSDKFTNLSTYGAVNVGLKIANAINNSLKSSLNIGDTIRNAIKSALEEKYSTTIDVEINTKEKKKSSSSNKTKKHKGNSSSGGLISTKSGYQVELQDSPEKSLLDNGEYVIPEKVVSALGVPFFEKLRSGRISKTFAGLAQSVSNTTSNIVNNVYNNNTQNLNLYTTGNEDFILQANRRFRKA